MQMLFRDVKEHTKKKKCWDECKIVASGEQEVGERPGGAGRGLLFFGINLIK